MIINLNDDVYCRILKKKDEYFIHYCFKSNMSKYLNMDLCDMNVINKNVQKLFKYKLKNKINTNKCKAIKKQNNDLIDNHIEKNLKKKI